MTEKTGAQLRAEAPKSWDDDYRDLWVRQQLDAQRADYWAREAQKDRAEIQRNSKKIEFLEEIEKLAFACHSETWLFAKSHTPPESVIRLGEAYDRYYEWLETASTEDTRPSYDDLKNVIAAVVAWAYTWRDEISERAWKRLFKEHIGPEALERESTDGSALTSEQVTADYYRNLWLEATAKIEGYSNKLEAEESAHEDTLLRLEVAEKAADDLSQAVSGYFGVDVGEHSNINSPWNEALEAFPLSNEDSDL